MWPPGDLVEVPEVLGTVCGVGSLRDVEALLDVAGFRVGVGGGEVLDSWRKPSLMLRAELVQVERDGADLGWWFE